MIMPRRNDPLLLPVSPLFVWTTLAVAFLINIVPLGRTPAMPDFLALVREAGFANAEGTPLFPSGVASLVVAS